VGQDDFGSSDPILIARRKLSSSEVTTEQLDQIEQAAATEMRQLLADVRQDPLPAPAEALRHVFADCGGAT
jgi:TPP-dependent pyruvate/acetoin dehydrogenase alpha subunit